MVTISKNRTLDQLIDDFMSAKARKHVLGEDFTLSSKQRDELKDVLMKYGNKALLRSRSGGGLGKKILENTIPRFLKYGLSDFVMRLEKLASMKSRSSYEFFCVIYGDEEASRVWKQKAERSALTEERLGKERWEKWNNSKKVNYLDRWVSQYGEELGQLKYQKHKENLSRSKTLDGYIDRHGEELGKLKYEIRYNKETANAFAVYKRAVHRLTAKTYKLHVNIINPEMHPRTRCGVDGGWQLDHIKSIKECFMQGVTVEDASSLTNLRMLPWKENLMRNHVSNT